MTLNWFTPFRDNDLRRQLDARRKELAEEVRRADDDYLLNVGEQQYLDYLVDEYTIATLELLEDDLTVEQDEEMIRAEDFPSHRFNVRPGKRYPKPVLIFHLPFTGDPGLFRSRASTWSTGVIPRIAVSDSTVLFKYVAFTHDPEAAKKSKQEQLRALQREVGHINKDLNAYNSGLRDEAERVVQGRKAEILKQRDMTAELGVPVRTKQPVSGTVAVPTPPVVRRPSKPQRPSASPGDYLPEPTLPVEVYREILEAVQTLGKTMERSPATYTKFDEEELRDQFITYLTPRVDGSTTGETFNRAGKTDILIRHENHNVFVAELGIWAGAKAFGGKIDQLLGYLTWRDSKAALVIFVGSKDFSTIAGRAKEAIAAHPNHVRVEGDVDEGWQDHILHLPDDPGREVQLALMLFHLPA